MLLLHVVGDALDRRGQPHARAGRSRRGRTGCSTSVGQGQRQADRGVGAGGAGAARVDHQRADPVGLAGEHDPDQEQRQGRRPRLGVADRHLGAAALERQVAVAAGLPGDQRLDLLVAVGPVDRLGLRLGRATTPARRWTSPAGDGVPANEVHPDSARVARDRGRAGWMATAARPRCRRMITSVGGRPAPLQALATDRGLTVSPAEHLGQVVADRHVELVVRAAQRRRGRAASAGTGRCDEVDGPRAGRT